jgi:hypothetical protein
MPRPSGSSYDEDIVERRVSDPLAVALLVVAALCLSGAIAFQVYEVFQYRIEGQDSVLDIAGRYAKGLETEAGGAWADFQGRYERAKAAVPTQGGAEDAFMRLEATDVGRQLIEEFGYGKKVLSPVMKEDGVDVSAGEMTAEEEAKTITTDALEGLVGDEGKTEKGPDDSGLDIDLNLEEEPAEEKKEEADDGGLDLDLDLDLGDEPAEEKKEESADEGDLDIDLDLDLGDEPAEEKKEESADEGDLDIDLDFGDDNT